MSAACRAGEYVAGVRYRAWALPSALCPTIGVHVRLSIDLVDAWMNRLLARFFPDGLYPGADAGAAAGAQPGVPVHAGPAPAVTHRRPVGRAAPMGRAGGLRA
jgi:uncharacterized protein (DUF2126 family)